MIRLKQLLFEMTDVDLTAIGKKIEASQFRYIGGGDNGRVYKINDEDLVFKMTTSIDEIEVARKLQNKLSEYSTFIPVQYVGDLGVQAKYKDIIIMSYAESLPGSMKRKIDDLIEQFKKYAYERGGEVSLFDFIDNVKITPSNMILMNFIQALQVDIEKIGIPYLELDLDFNSSNIKLWNGKLVMIDW